MSDDDFDFSDPDPRSDNIALDRAIDEGMKSSGFDDEHFDKVSGPQDGGFRSQFFSGSSPRETKERNETKIGDYFAENRRLWKEHGLSEADALRNLALLERAYHHDRQGTAKYLAGEAAMPAVVQIKAVSSLTPKAAIIWGFFGAAPFGKIPLRPAGAINAGSARDRRTAAIP